MKTTLLPDLFQQQEVPLGECSFEEANELQIEKFHLSWKVDIQIFQRAIVSSIWMLGSAPKIG